MLLNGSSRKQRSTHFFYSPLLMRWDYYTTATATQVQLRRIVAFTTHLNRRRS